MQCDLRQVTTIEVMEALNRLLHRPNRKNIACGEIAQIVADKRGADPMVSLHRCSCYSNRS
jgi:hypothetical protein